MGRRWGGRSGWAAVISMTAFTGLVVVACGGSDESMQFSSVGGSISGSGGSGSGSAQVSSAGDAVRDVADRASVGDGPAATVEQVALVSTAGRDLAVTGSMRIEVDDVAAAQARGSAAIEGLGGFVADEQSTFGALARATVTYRVPTTGYSSAMRTLTSLGSVVEQSRATEDVTEQVVDLESRLVTARVSVERMRAFFDEARDLTQVASLEGELLKRETEVERLTASLRTVEDRVALATLVVTWSEPVEVVKAKVEKPPVKKVEDEEALPTFGDGLDVGWTVLLRGGQVVGAGLGLVLPFAPLVLALVAVNHLVRRLATRRRRTAEAPA